MTIREDLERAIQATAIDNLRSVDRQDLEYAARVSRDLLRDHGPALVEALDRANRYEAVRKMNVPQFKAVVMQNIKTGIPFDTLVDTWAFNNGYPSKLDAARGES